MRLDADKVRGEVVSLNLRPEANGPDEWKPAIDIGMQFELEGADSVAWLIKIGFERSKADKGSAEKFVQTILREQLAAGLPAFEFVDHKINIRHGDNRLTMNPVRIKKVAFKPHTDGDKIVWSLKIDSRIDIATELPYLAETLKSYISIRVTPPKDLVSAMQENGQADPDAES